MPLRSSSSALRGVVLASTGVLAMFRPAAAAETDFVTAALAHGGFKAFVGLVSQAGLADTLGAGPVTVFMPTDGAFARLTAAQRKVIADLSPEGARNFVRRFVFPGTAMASNDLDQTITAQSGVTYDVTWYKGRLSLRDHFSPAKGRLAYVVGGDIPAGAGVIDALDTVLLPSSDRTPSAEAGTPTHSGPGTATAVASDPGSNPVADVSVRTPEKAPAPTPSATVTTVTKPTDVTTVVVEPRVSVTAATAQPAASPQPQVSSGGVEASVRPTTLATTSTPMPKPEIDVATAGLRGWPLKISGNGSTGTINRIIVGLPDGRITGVTAHFGGFLGFGGRTVFVPWGRVTPDLTKHVLRAHMTKAEFASASASGPKP